MEKSLHQLIWQTSHHLKGFIMLYTSQLLHAQPWGLRALPCQKPRHGIQHRNRPMPTILGGANIHHPLNCSHNLPFGASLLELRSQQIELLDSIIRVRLSRVLTGQGALWKVLLRSRMARACTLEFVVGRVRSPTDNFSLKNRIFQMDSKECSHF